MPVNVRYSNKQIPTQNTVVLLANKKNNISKNAAKFNKNNKITKAIKIAKFKGEFGKILSIIDPQNGVDRIIVVGTGSLNETKEYQWAEIGGKIYHAIGQATKVNILAEGQKSLTPQQIADIALGMKLRSYKFNKYKTDKNAKKNPSVSVAIHAKNALTAKKIWSKNNAIADGVFVARDLVNEPANILTPVNFAKKARELTKVGCKVQVLDQKAMQKLKMGALLGVAQGSRNPPKLVVIKWNGNKKQKSKKPIAFVGKGVTFDTGGISLKPPPGMDEMKGDMGGAAAVTGLMYTLAKRKAKTNVVGILGLVENMADGNAQRPGDIVRAMSGTTIEVLNTDAEGRLVLADALHYCQKRFKPEMIVNLATLTGAILIALGQHHAGLFSNNDKLAKNLHAAGQDTRERVWRMPLDPEYNKLMDSPNADVKNIGGGRYAGSITAAEFLQRFIMNKTPWAHLDIAGTAFGAPKTSINQSWGTGFGVRLLNRLVEDHYE